MPKLDEIVVRVRALLEPSENYEGTQLRRRVVDLRAALREGEGEDGLGFVGHAAVFNQRTYIGLPPWGFFEEIAPRAFEPVLEDDVRMLKNHDANYLLARTTNGTLRLAEDKTGLATDADMAPVTYARDLAVLIKRGDLSQMSFAFWPDDEDVTEIEVKDEDTGVTLKAPLVTITKMRNLYDVSPVTFPAYAGTDAGLRYGFPVRGQRDEGRIVRAMLEQRHELDELELRAMELRPAPAGLIGGGKGQ